MSWIVISPGVMALPETKFQIKYDRDSAEPYHVFWAGQIIPRGTCMTLSGAKELANMYLKDLSEMGFEV